MNWGAALLLLLREAAIMGTQRLRVYFPQNGNALVVKGVPQGPLRRKPSKVTVRSWMMTLNLIPMAFPHATPKCQQAIYHHRVLGS